MQAAVAALITTLLLLAAGFALASEPAETDNAEVRVSLDQLPAAVRVVFEKFAMAGEVDEIYREDEGGVVAYSAEVEIGGTEFELKLSSEGQILEVEYEEGAGIAEDADSNAEVDKDDDEGDDEDEGTADEPR